MFEYNNHYKKGLYMLLYRTRLIVSAVAVAAVAVAAVAVAAVAVAAADAEKQVLALA